MEIIGGPLEHRLHSFFEREFGGSLLWKTPIPLLGEDTSCKLLDLKEIQYF